jgi:hypothetical protein
MGAVTNPSWRSNIPEDRSNKKSSCAQQLGFYSVLPADLRISRVIDRVLAQRGLQRCVALTVPHLLVLLAIIASTDLFIDEIEVFELPIVQRPPCGIDLSLWTI